MVERGREPSLSDKVIGVRSPNTNYPKINQFADEISADEFKSLTNV